MPGESKEEPRALTVQAADYLQVSPEAVVRWLEEGHLVAFVPPGRAITDRRRAAKGYRILPEDWKLFIAAHRMTGSGEASRPMPAPVLVRHNQIPAGADGVIRLRRDRAFLEANRERVEEFVEPDGKRGVRLRGSGGA